ncbi:hypothetical protein HAX54_045769, partial [Datura stramonium]|nr:hypothetical protein [Datura stramonium]
GPIHSLHCNARSNNLVIPSLIGGLQIILMNESDNMDLDHIHLESDVVQVHTNVRSRQVI